MEKKSVVNVLKQQLNIEYRAWTGTPTATHTIKPDKEIRRSFLKHLEIQVEESRKFE